MSVNEDPSTWRIATSGGIPYKRLGMTGSVGVEDSSVSEDILLESDQLLAFIDEALPQPYILFGTVIYPPRAYLLGFDSLRVNRISWDAMTEGRPIDPFGADPGAPDDTYEPFLRVTLEFGTAPENDSGNPDPNNPETFLEITADASGTFLTSPIDGGTAWWIGHAGFANEEVKEPVSQPVTEVETEWNFRWSRIPFAWFRDTMIGRMRSRLGKVNSSVMTLIGNAPAETVLFVGFSLRRQYTWRRGLVGNAPVQLDLKFIEKNFESAETPAVSVTHNHMWRPGVGFRRMTINGDPLYASADLNGLFG